MGFDRHGSGYVRAKITCASELDVGRLFQFETIIILMNKA
jgi:hypothetical protein